MVKTTRTLAKTQILRLLNRLVEIEFFNWLFEKFIWRAASYIQELRNSKQLIASQSSEEEIIHSAILSLFPDLTVHNGPFKGLKYLEPKSIGSELFPKLLGSYEKELHPLMKKICQTSYEQILNIGSAEGYYAIGLAMKIPAARVFAYDIEAEAVRLCHEMAKANQVEDRVSVKRSCTPKILLNFSPLRHKTLIISDCEGYEAKLFSAKVVAKLSQADFLIEVHDFIDIKISAKIKSIFSQTHQIQVISSLDDLKKAQTYDYAEIHQFDLNTKKILLAEKRPTIMEWYFMTPLTNHMTQAV